MTRPRVTCLGDEDAVMNTILTGDAWRAAFKLAFASIKSPIINRQHVRRSAHYSIDPQSEGKYSLLLVLHRYSAQ